MKIFSHTFSLNYTLGFVNYQYSEVHCKISIYSDKCKAQNISHGLTQESINLGKIRLHLIAQTNSIFGHKVHSLINFFFQKYKLNMIPTKYILFNYIYYLIVSYHSFSKLVTKIIYTIKLNPFPLLVRYISSTRQLLAQNLGCLFFFSNLPN